MPLPTIAVMFLAVVPMVDRCRSVLARAERVPDAKSAVGLSAPRDAPGDETAPVGLRPLPVCGADAADATPSAGSPPGIEPGLGSPSVAVPEPRAVSSNALAKATARMAYAALTDGSANPRAREWRLPLVRMLVDGTPGTDFDRVYGLLLLGFGGNDERAKIRALAKWAGENLPPREAADIYRAETRRWLNLGDAAMTADAAKRMERARPDYAVRARRLSALGYATAGELDKAKAEIARARAGRGLPRGERLELAYLEAWVALQEGNAELARRNLSAIVAESPGGATAVKAKAILESISEEERE